MFTEQKLLFSWWPVQQGKHEKCRPSTQDMLLRATEFAASLDCRQECFLTWRSAPWNLHVELDGVHAQDGVSYVAEHVPAGRHAHESGQLLQLLKLRLPPEHREQSRSVHFQTCGVQDQLLLVRTGDIHARRQRSAHLLGSERSMLVPNLMIFPTAFCSALRGGRREGYHKLRTNTSPPPSCCTCSGIYLLPSLEMSLLGASELLDGFFFPSSSSSSSSLPFSS